jgi:hypothetical protein
VRAAACCACCVVPCSALELFYSIHQQLFLKVEDLVAKSAANKALNDKKRLATSSANLARSR